MVLCRARSTCVVVLVGALLAEQTDEWAIAHRYMSIETLKTARHLTLPDTDPRPAMDAALEALTAR